MLRPRSISLLLALATLLVYLPATSNQFINFDDPNYVTDNQIVQNGLTWAGVKWAFTDAHASNWHPLTWLSHMADCELFQLNPAGPHLVNILFHALNTACVFLLLFRLTEKLWPCVFVAASFAWHPLHVESVAWIAERKDVLSTFFSLLTLLSYTRHAQKRREAGNRASNAGPAGQALAQRFWTRDYILALFFFALALLSKPMAVTLPVVMLLLDYWPLGRVAEFKSNRNDSTIQRSSTITSLRSAVFEKWPFFLFSALSCIITILSQRHTAVLSLAKVPMSLRLENALCAYAGYLWKMVWPIDLAVFYPLPTHIEWQLTVASAILLLGVSVLVWRERKAGPWLLVGWLWFLVTLLPVIGLLQVGEQAMADRYSYFPLIGIFLAVAFSAQAVVARLAFPNWAWAAAAMLTLGLCIVLTERQLRYWRDSELLFTHALAVTPSETAHINLGVALCEKGRLPEAMFQYLLAQQLNPRSATAYANIGTVLDKEGNEEAALVYFQKAMENNPQSPLINEYFGIVLTKLKHFDEALQQFSIVAQSDVSSADPHFLMGRLLLQQGRDAEAVTQLRAGLQLNPNALEMVILTANLLASDEDPHARNGAEALGLAEKLIQQTGDEQPAALDALAMAYAETGQFDLAVQFQQKAVELIKQNGPKDDLEVMQKRLASYQQHHPWRESFKKQNDWQTKPVSN